MRSLVVLLLILVFMFIGFLINKFLQNVIRPRESGGRLLLYFISVLMSVFLLSFLMVLMITKRYPNELIK